MEKTEKIISEFERFIQEYERDIGFTSYNSEVLKGVLTLLKAQEPRLVTIDDFKGADEYGWLPAWCEEYAGAIYCECILVDALKEKGIRYWTSRPDEKRRVETPWE